MYDVVIVGSGLGGLLCGYVLSKEGYNVCILEKHHAAGGCLQTFTRQGCVFDTGMHYLGSLDEGQVMWRFFKFFQLLDNVKLKKLDEDGFDHIHIAGKEYQYAQGYDAFIHTLMQHFPAEKQALHGFVDKLKEVNNGTKLFMEQTAIEMDSLPTMKYFEANAFKFIQSLTHDPELQQVLSATNSLHFGKADLTPLYVHMVINNSLIESAWRFVDGGSQIADALVQSFQQFGGSIRMNAGVKRFIMNENDTEVKAVELESGEQIMAKHFISNIHPATTLEMIESKLIRKAYTNRIHAIQQTLGVFSVYIVLKKDEFKYFNYNYYHCESKNVWVADIYDKVPWPSGYMLYTPANSKSEVFADSITIMTYMDYQELKQWEHTSVERRGTEYREFKQRKAEQLLDLVEQRFPGLRSKIKTYYTSTPLSYRDYTGTYRGSSYGIMRDCNNALKTIIAPKTRIPNLHLTGQNINLHGVLGVTIGAFITLGNFVGTRYMSEKINNL